MKRPSLIALLIIIIFTGAWYLRASSFGPCGDEPEHWDRSYAFAKTGSIHMCWDSELGALSPCEVKRDRGVIFSYLGGLVFQMIGDMPIASRSIMLIFTLLTYFIMVFYYRRRGVLTARRLLVWTLLYFGSSIILDLSYYTRGYAPLGTFMIIAFISYWEGLVQFRQKNLIKAIVLWLVSLLFTYIPFNDQWQIEGVLALSIAIMISIAAFNKRCAPIAGWLKQRSGMLLWGIILLAPIVVQKLAHISWVTVASIHVLNGFYSTYLDNIFGWLRLMLALNVGLLALGYAFKSKVMMSFDRWMFINGFLTAIFCILYNSHNHIFYTKFVYLPTLMMIIGLAGIIEDFSLQRSRLIKMVSIYVIINISLSWVYTFEHSNIKIAIQWLNAHMNQEDILIATDKADAALKYEGGQDLLSKRYLIFDSIDQTHTMDLRNYVYNHPRARIFYIYDDGYWFRTWAFKIITGKDRNPPVDLWSYLRLKIPSVVIVPGLRQSGLVEFDRFVLLNGLDQLLRDGFEVPRPYTARDFINHLKSILHHQ